MYFQIITNNKNNNNNKSKFVYTSAVVRGSQCQALMPKNNSPGIKKTKRSIYAKH